MLPVLAGAGRRTRIWGGSQTGLRRGVRAGWPLAARVGVLMCVDVLNEATCLPAMHRAITPARPASDWPATSRARWLQRGGGTQHVRCCRGNAGPATTGRFSRSTPTRLCQGVSHGVSCEQPLAAPARLHTSPPTPPPCPPATRVPKLMSDEMPCHLPNCLARDLMAAAERRAAEGWFQAARRVRGSLQATGHLTLEMSLVTSH